MKELLEYLLKKIVGKKDFAIEETNEDSKVNFNVSADPSIIGLIIGKNGRTIKSIQNILRVRARLEKASVFVNVTEANK
jgi:predicted RNA-binding protein YlqC (UPF0109 family)